MYSTQKGKENVFVFGKSKPNCNSKVLLCPVVHRQLGICCTALGEACSKLTYALQAPAVHVLGSSRKVVLTG